jgi:feruloyl esterase
MRINIKALGVAVFATLGFGAGGAHAAIGPCESLTNLKLPHVTITSVTEVAAGAIVSGGPPAIPGYCKVMGTSRPTSDSDIRFEVAIPEGEAWNGRYLQVGNGGFAGSIPSSTIAMGLRAGYATAGTDDGHQSAVGTDASWALHHPEKGVDFGYRALKETTLAAKAIVAAYEGRSPRYSYFAGCSDGGREALMEAQRYPDDFNGILAGDPANHWTHLLTAAAWNVQALTATPGSAVPAAKLKVLEAAALKACGDQDGIIEDPLVCKFDPAVIRCTGADAPDCLTDAQLTAVKKIYAGVHNPRTGAKIMDGYSPGGEGEGAGWAPWLSGFGAGDVEHTLQYGFGHNFFGYVVFSDPDYDIRKLNFDSDVAMFDAKSAPIYSSYSANLSAFKKHGGKLIQYHGWADPAIPAKDSITYYTSVQARMGDTQGFYRLFMVPGMLHCGGGRGPNDVTMPALTALATWVEKGEAPAQIDVPKRASAGLGALGAVEFTRPVCPFPKVAVWDGTGDRNRAQSWRCTAPKKRA